MEKYTNNNWIRLSTLNDKPAIELNADTLEDWINNDLFFVNVYRIARDLGSNVVFVLLGEPDNQDLVFERLTTIKSKLLITDVVVEFVKSYNIKPATMPEPVEIESPTAENHVIVIIDELILPETLALTELEFTINDELAVDEDVILPEVESKRKKK